MSIPAEDVEGAYQPYSPAVTIQRILMTLTEFTCTGSRGEEVRHTQEASRAQSTASTAREGECGCRPNLLYALLRVYSVFSEQELEQAK